MKTLQDKYTAVLENKYSKAQFVRDARMELPKLISPVTPYEDIVNILKGKGILHEACLDDETVSRMDKFSSEEIARGVDTELEERGIDSTDTVSEEDYEKALKKTLSKLETNRLYYLEKMAGETGRKKKRTDQMKPVKGNDVVDKDNGLKKVSLKEAMKAPSANSFDYSKISNVSIDGIDYRDAPDFVDAYISYAEYDGRPMTDDELDALNDDSDFVHQKVQDYLYESVKIKEGIKVGSSFTIPKDLTSDPLNKQGQTGKIIKIDDNGDFHVKFADGKVGAYVSSVYQKEATIGKNYPGTLTGEFEGAPQTIAGVDVHDLLQSGLKYTKTLEGFLGYVILGITDQTNKIPAEDIRKLKTWYDANVQEGQDKLEKPSPTVKPSSQDSEGDLDIAIEKFKKDVHDAFGGDRKVYEGANSKKLLSDKQALALARKVKELSIDAYYRILELAIDYEDAVPLEKIKKVLANYDISLKDLKGIKPEKETGRYTMDQLANMGLLEGQLKEGIKKIIKSILSEK